MLVKGATGISWHYGCLAYLTIKSFAEQLVLSNVDSRHVIIDGKWLYIILNIYHDAYYVSGCLP